MRLLVCGCHTYKDGTRLWAALDRVLARRHVTAVLHSARSNVGEHVKAWAKARDLPAEPWWVGDMVRTNSNFEKLVLQRCQVGGVVAFPGDSPTLNMVDQARVLGLPVWSPFEQQRSRP